MSKVLIIDDEVHIAEGIKLNLELNGHKVHIKENGFLGVNEWKSWRPDIIVLDLMMPIMDGYTTLQKIREEDKKIPILVLSAKDAIKDKVKCLSIGVDDYLSKPFSLEEFLLRIDRLLLRASWGQEGDLKPKNIPDEIVFGNNRVDFKTKKGFINGDEVNLTLQELNLLQVFAQNIGLPLSRSELLEQGWGYSQDTSTRTVDNFIVRFRKYFEKNPKKPIHFKSVRSIGYVFNKN
ncbi:MAG: response regulator transcription factor [Bacteriovoracaceae bacterium]|jgi:two-component system, OmpR family, alkaline phosphatase synthesis response regulator PhoP|nr:response regulator transcription factor [Bacteriovoracaceae bacterium]